jgi:NADH-quinone oxidoreductase subunit F
MSPLSSLAALDRLRSMYPEPAATRLLLHRGTCGVATGVDALRDTLPADLEVTVTTCDGACWAAPAATVQRRMEDGSEHVHRFDRLDQGVPEQLAACLTGDCDESYAGSGQRGITARVGRVDGSLGDALHFGAYAAYAQALTLEPAGVIEAVETAALTGRGGAHFPTAMKWRFVSNHGGLKHIVINAEEGEPGVFKDRHLIEGDPHRLIEGILICAYATGATSAYVYINGQARRAQAAFLDALEEAGKAGILDGTALGGPDVTIEMRSGAGGYVCGEESVILNSIEGERPVPRYKPPFATDSGLFERPTVINNAETLCAATTIFDDPPPPTKLIPLSGAVPRPGLYEVPVDGAMSWSGVLAMAGANPGDVEALLLGGPSGTFVLPADYEAPLEMRGLGAGGVVALPRGVDLLRVTRSLAAYNARESCGECTPCREGAPRLLAFLEDPAANREQIDELIEVLTEASLCQLGGMAGRPVASALESFPEAFER